MSYLQQYHRLKANWADFEPTIKYDEFFSTTEGEFRLMAKLRFMYCGKAGKEKAVFVMGTLAVISAADYPLTNKLKKKFMANTLYHAWKKMLEEGKYVYYDEEQEKQIRKRVTYIMPRLTKGDELIVPVRGSERVQSLQ